jgi:hypothetical protein
MFDDADAPGRQQYVKSDFLRGLDFDAIATLADHCPTLSSPFN